MHSFRPDAYWDYPVRAAQLECHPLKLTGTKNEAMNNIPDYLRTMGVAFVTGSILTNQLGYERIVWIGIAIMAIGWLLRLVPQKEK